MRASATVPRRFSAPLQEISDTVGHKSTHVTETVYRHMIVPAIRGGATPMKGNSMAAVVLRSQTALTGSDRRRWPIRLGNCLPSRSPILVRAMMSRSRFTRRPRYILRSAQSGHVALRRAAVECGALVSDLGSHEVLVRL